MLNFDTDPCFGHSSQENIAVQKWKFLDRSLNPTNYHPLGECLLRRNSFVPLSPHDISLVPYPPIALAGLGNSII